jgi:hypothetical protein
VNVEHANFFMSSLPENEISIPLPEDFNASLPKEM